MAGALSVEVVYALKCEISAKEAALTKLKAEVEQLKKQPAPPLLGPPPLAPPLFAPPPLAPPLLPGGLAPLAPPPPPPLPGSETAPTTAALIAPSTSMPPPSVPFHAYCACSLACCACSHTNCARRPCHGAPARPCHGAAPHAEAIGGPDHSRETRSLR
jgi:hypothetical protein